MNLPFELIIKILSYLNINHINKLELPFSYHKHYLIERNILKNNNWYVGVYNNIYDHCFTCKTHLDKNLRVLVICMNCEFTLDNYYCYPVVCINCTNVDKSVKRGNVFTCFCPSCENSKMNIAIECFS